MKIKHYMMAALVLMSSFMMSGCKDDDGDSMSKAVLASASNLTFQGTGAAPQIITVYSDANWVADVPEWITISPAAGTAGATEVAISVSDNLREGTLDNPRKADLIFRGTSLASRAFVKVLQLGDNYRDCKDFTVEQLYGAEDESYMSVPNVKVVSVLSNGFIITDNNYKANMLVKSPVSVSKGDVVSLMAQKLTDGMAYIVPDEVNIVSTGNEVVYPEPIDITEKLDEYNSDKREFIACDGILAGNTVTVPGKSLSIQLETLPESVDLSAVNGHFVKIMGYFAGVAAPVLKLHYADIVDRGEAMTIYWSEDFEWLDPYAVAAGAGRSVENDDVSASAPQISHASTKVDGLTACDALEARGYQMLRVTTKAEGECIYLQQNYLKMGKTSYQGGLVLPSLKDIPADAANIRLSFDWCPMRQGSGKIDPVHLIVIVTNGSEETTFEVPTHGWANDHKLEWINAVVDLSSAKIGKDTKITIRQTEWPAATANRWFIDNIKVYSPMM